ncbi:Protein NYNRIN, partial [Mucuna pruriens]
MDKIFKEIIGTDVEVYVDDMVVKSRAATDHCRALERVFQVLRQHQLKLNPEKCSFGVQAGKFLGFTAVPIFNTLKKGDTFAWTVESEEAFLRLKALLASPLILTKSIPGIPLLVYISVVENVVSAAIVQEKEGKQHPIYFISKVLQDTARRYQKIEKAAFTLIIAPRRVRPCFQGYPVIVLRKPDLARRMVTWSVQLSEFDISYKSRGHIKAQVLADFITKMATSGPEVEENNGAGVILEGLNGVLTKKSLHFEFKANKNQAEYEALLVEMRLAKELEAITLTAKSDSKLVGRAEQGIPGQRPPTDKIP